MFENTEVVIENGLSRNMFFFIDFLLFIYLWVHDENLITISLDYIHKGLILMICL